MVHGTSEIGKPSYIYIRTVLGERKVCIQREFEQTPACEKTKYLLKRGLPSDRTISSGDV